MALHEVGSFCDGASDQCNIYSSSPSSQYSPGQQIIEIYTFIDPICPQCWALEPILKKLQIEYGKYFKMRYLIGETWGPYQSNTNDIHEYTLKWEKEAKCCSMPYDKEMQVADPASLSYQATLAIKAAELQGKQAGLRFLRKLREAFFLNQKNIARESELLDCARDADLDVEEFCRDIQANSSVKAFHCDRKMTSEMEIEQLPTLVFLNADADEAGIKVSGYYPYEAYEQVIWEIMGDQPKASEPPDLESFLQKYSFVATKEIAVVYNLSYAEVDREMKKLLLRQQVERIPVKNGTFWRSLINA